MSHRLIAVSGPLAGQTFSLEARLTLGRDRGNDVHLKDIAVSRHHGVIETVEGSVLLRDLDSRHGTFVNGVPVRERSLVHGDMVTLGTSLFLVQTEDQEASAPSGVLLEDSSYVAESTVYLDAGVRLSEDRTARDLQALLRIGSALHALRATAPLARRLLELILETLPADRAAVLLLDPGTGEFTDSFALDRAAATEPFPVSRTLLHRLVTERSAVLLNDVVEAPGWGEAASLLASRIQSLAAAPLVGPQGPLGALYADTRQPGSRFDAGHLDLLNAVAGIAAAALANVRHVEWLEAERQRLAVSLEGDLVGESPRMREVYRLLARVAATDSTVLLRGESGTGKEMAARALHRGSSRDGRPFVAINCATLSETLLESELFGHERGAFTGAIERRTGKLEVAHTGTLFLDEVGEIPPLLQAKLLRVLQEREFERLGSSRPIKVDVRVIAATNRDLEKAIREGTFRDDLFYRLNVVSFTLPPLRERREDIHLLASHFAATVGRKTGRRVGGFTPEARACLSRYDWPGNVRELANAVERAVVLGEGELIRPEDLPETVLEAAPSAPAGGPLPKYHEAVHGFKRRLILDAAAAAQGNITRTAESLGLNPTYLHRLIRNLDLKDQIRS